MNIHTYIYIHVCIYICTYVCIYVCVYVYVCMYVNIYIYMHTHIYPTDIYPHLYSEGEESTLSSEMDNADLQIGDDDFDYQASLCRCSLCVRVRCVPVSGVFSLSVCPVCV